MSQKGIFFEASKEVAPYWAFLERGSTGVGVKLSRGPLGPQRRKGPEKEGVTHLQLGPLLALWVRPDWGEPRPPTQKQLALPFGEKLTLGVEGEKLTLEKLLLSGPWKRSKNHFAFSHDALRYKHFIIA